MKRNYRILFTLFVIFASGMVTADDNAVDSTRLVFQAAVDAGNAKFIEARRKQDGKLLASLFCDDGAFLVRNGVVIQGDTTIEKEFGEWLRDNGPIEMTITTLDMWVIDSQIYEVGSYTRKSQKPGADTTTSAGRYFEIWKQQPTGDWKIFRDCGLPK
jgi:ketosteroid isomerase-like protein